MEIRQRGASTAKPINPAVIEAIRGIQTLPADQQVEHCIGLLASTNSEIVDKVLLTLLKMPPDKSATPVVSKLVHHKNGEIRRNAAYVLGHIGGEEAGIALAPLAAGKGPGKRKKQYFECLAKTHSKAGAVLLATIAQETKEDAEDRRLALMALGIDGSNLAVDVLKLAAETMRTIEKNEDNYQSTLSGTIGALHIAAKTNDRARDALTELCSDPNPDVRRKICQHCSWGDYIKGDENHPPKAIIKLAIYDKDLSVQYAAVKALRYASHTNALSALTYIAASTHHEAERNLAFESLQECKIDGVQEKLIELFHDKEPAVGLGAAVVLAKLYKMPEAYKVLYDAVDASIGRIDSAQKSTLEHFELIANALASYHNPESIGIFAHLAKQEDLGIRKRALSALGLTSCPEAIEAIAPYLDDKNAEIQHRARMGLASLMHDIFESELDFPTKQVALRRIVTLMEKEKDKLDDKTMLRFDRATHVATIDLREALNNIKDIDPLIAYVEKQVEQNKQLSAEQLRIMYGENSKKDTLEENARRQKYVQQLEQRIQAGEKMVQLNSLGRASSSKSNQAQELLRAHDHVACDMPADEHVRPSSGEDIPTQLQPANRRALLRDVKDALSKDVVIEPRIGKRGWRVALRAKSAIASAPEQIPAGDEIAPKAETMDFRHYVQQERQDNSHENNQVNRLH